jgi:hypothetical protein
MKTSTNRIQIGQLIAGVRQNYEAVWALKCHELLVLRKKSVVSINAA